MYYAIIAKIIQILENLVNKVRVCIFAQARYRERQPLCKQETNDGASCDKAEE